MCGVLGAGAETPSEHTVRVVGRVRNVSASFDEGCQAAAGQQGENFSRSDHLGVSLLRETKSLPQHKKGQLFTLASRSKLRRAEPLNWFTRIHPGIRTPIF